MEELIITYPRKLILDMLNISLVRIKGLESKLNMNTAELKTLGIINEDGLLVSDDEKLKEFFEDYQQAAKNASKVFPESKEAILHYKNEVLKVFEECGVSEPKIINELEDLTVKLNNSFIILKAQKEKLDGQ